MESGEVKRGVPTVIIAMMKDALCAEVCRIILLVSIKVVKAQTHPFFWRDAKLAKILKRSSAEKAVAEIQINAALHCVDFSN